MESDWVVTLDRFLTAGSGRVLSAMPGYTVEGRLVMRTSTERITSLKITAQDSTSSKVEGGIIGGIVSIFTGNPDYIFNGIKTGNLLSEVAKATLPEEGITIISRTSLVNHPVKGPPGNAYFYDLEKPTYPSDNYPNPGGPPGTLDIFPDLPPPGTLAPRPPDPRRPTLNNNNNNNNGNYILDTT